jgi:hypothetical protein
VEGVSRCLLEDSCIEIPNDEAAALALGFGACGGALLQRGFQNGDFAFCRDNTETWQQLGSRCVLFTSGA